MDIVTLHLCLFLSGYNNVSWNPHNVELALWTHYVASELKPEMLETIPSPVKNGKVKNGDVESSTMKTPVSTFQSPFPIYLSFCVGCCRSLFVLPSSEAGFNH